MSVKRAAATVIIRSGLFTAVASMALLGGCDGPHAKAGKQADAAAGIKAGPLTKGPNERLGAIQDRTERDQARAIDAQADAVEDRAKQVRSAADAQADALERQAAETRKIAKQSAKSLDQKANAIRGK